MGALTGAHRTFKGHTSGSRRHESTEAMTTDTSALPYRPCVGLMVLNRAGLVWVGRRADTPGEPEGPGAWWQMPQGGIDEGEVPRKAALRELREETSIQSVEFIAEMADWLHYELPASLQGKTWGGRYRGQKQKWYALRFLGHDREVDIRPEAGQKAEFDAWKWAPIADLISLIVPFKREVYRAVVAEFEPHARPMGVRAP